MVASQATEAGSIPVPCSKTKTASHRDAVFVLGKKEGNRTHPMQVPGGHLPFGSWMPNAPYDLPPRANRPSIPVPCSKTKQHPIGMLFCFWKKGRESNPSNASARRALAVRQLNAERSLRFAPKGKSAIDSRTLKGPQHGAVDDIHFEPVHLFSSRASCFGRSKKQGTALWFLSIAQLRCGAYTNRIQIERKVRSFL